MDITNLPVHELVKEIENGNITTKQVLDSYMENINKYEEKIGAFTNIFDDNYQRLEQIQKTKTNNKYKAIPIGIKDNINIKSKKTTCSSKMLENFVSPFDATVIEKLNQEQLLPIGKLNMDEFAMGGSTETSAFHLTHNPWNLSRVPGGSSGGTAAAVASNMIPWGLGSDTGGSIRQPSSFCGVVGLKPTYGLVSRYGLVAFASSLDQIGPITKDVTDCAILLNMIVGHDEKDSTSANFEKIDYEKDLNNSISGKKVAVPKEFLDEGVSDEVRNKIQDTIKILEKQGAIVEYISLDIAKQSLATYYIIACAEASSNLGRFDGIRYTYRAKDYKDLNDLYVKSRSNGFGSEVKRRIILGTYVLSSGYYDAYYKKAQKVRSYVIDKFDEVFKNYDIILTPTSPTTAFEIGGKSLSPLEMYMADICTVSVNIAGLPGISVPVGVDSQNLPIGVQLIGNKFEESKILNFAKKIEDEVKFREKYSPKFN